MPANLKKTLYIAAVAAATYVVLETTGLGDKLKRTFG